MDALLLFFALENNKTKLSRCLIYSWEFVDQLGISQFAYSIAARPIVILSNWLRVCVCACVCTQEAGHANKWSVWKQLASARARVMGANFFKLRWPLRETFAVFCVSFVVCCTKCTGCGPASAPFADWFLEVVRARRSCSCPLARQITRR